MQPTDHLAMAKIKIMRGYLPENYITNITFDGKIASHYVSWVDFHKDNGPGQLSKKSPLIGINVFFAKKDATLVAWDGKKFYLESLESGGKYVFSAFHRHALLPHSIARRCVDEQTTKYGSEKEIEKLPEDLVLVFNFEDQYGQQTNRN